MSSPVSLLARTFRLVLATLVPCVLACSAKRDPIVSEADDDASRQEEEEDEPEDEAEDEPDPFEEEDVCPEDNPFCDTTKPPPPPACSASEEIDLTPVGVNIMVAIDGSARMQTHWPRIQGVLDDLRAAHPEAAFGVHLFWGVAEEDPFELVTLANPCGDVENQVLELGQHSSEELEAFFGDDPPGPVVASEWDFSGAYQFATAIDPLNYYLTNAGKFADPTRTNYLVFVTDGNDNCFGTPWTDTAELLAFEKLAVELGKLNIRLIPVGFDPVAGQRNPRLDRINPITTRDDVLEVLTKFGGSGLDKPARVDDPDDLDQVLAQVGKRLRSCRFSIPATLDPTKAVNAFELNFTVNGQPVERDRGRAGGWDFVDGNTSQVELFGEACEAVRSGAELASHKTCAEDVCGTAAVKVETKARAVLYIFDNSVSRIECSDTVTPETCAWQGADVPRTLTFWETAQKAMAASLVAPINDDVEFGVQFFPGEGTGLIGGNNLLSCSVGSEPEVQPAQGTEIEILRAMLEEYPFGFSPLVAALESVAANPGRLADPEVSGAVVVMSDGGDTCETTTQEDMVARLSAATGKLLEAGVKTYVVRYGADGSRTPEQEEQLRAIVGAGGTATSDPADMSQVPYIEAIDETALNDGLARIADVLSTCDFELGGVEEDADKENVNLYLNGELIRFDARAEKADGWGWLDAEQTKIELYGAACTDFKTNRKTSIVVEFGCAPIVLL